MPGPHFGFHGKNALTTDTDYVSHHIALDDSGTAIIRGTTTKVIEIALDRISHHWDADEIQRQYPHLSLSQIHAALACYYDHQSEFDAAMTAQLERVDLLRSQTENPALQKKLLAARQTHKSTVE